MSFQQALPCGLWPKTLKRGGDVIVEGNFEPENVLFSNVILLLRAFSLCFIVLR